MILEYKEEEIIKKERQKGHRNYNKPLLGYINPYGEIIDYSLLIGEYGHDNWRNPVTPIFLSYISFVIKGSPIKKLENLKWDKNKKLFYNNKYDGFEDVVKRGLEFLHYINFDSYDDFLTILEKRVQQEKKEATFFAKNYDSYYGSYYSKDPWDQLRNDLTLFFEKCYSDKNFFYSFNRIVQVENIYDICKKYNLTILDDKNEFYYDYCIMQLMSYFKDICVQYLGYDSIERAIPENKLTLFNNLYHSSNGYIFSPKPKTICTSCQNPNERFYNWKIMDWNIQKIPRYFWNDKEKRFILEDPIMIYHQTEKEIILGKEIESIKKQVPKEYRKEYFRK